MVNQKKELILELIRFTIGVIAAGKLPGIFPNSVNLSLIKRLGLIMKLLINDDRVKFPILGAIAVKPTIIVNPLRKSASIIKNYLGFAPSKAVALINKDVLAKASERELGLILRELCKHPTVESILVAAGLTTVVLVSGLTVVKLFSQALKTMDAKNIAQKALARALMEQEFLIGPFAQFAESNVVNTVVNNLPQSAISTADLIRRRNLMSSLLTARTIVLEQELLREFRETSMK